MMSDAEMSDRDEGDEAIGGDVDTNDAVEVTTGSTGVVMASKKELKRALQREAFKANKKAKKELKKLNKRIDSDSRKKAATSEAGSAAAPADDHNDGFTHRKRMKKEAFEEACSSNFHVIIDCSWESEHNDTALGSLTQQIMFCHGINRKQDKPATIHISGIGPRATHNLHKISFENWAGVTVSSSDYIDNPAYCVQPTEGRRQLVYLTSDAEEILTELDPQCAYIIGGIVDRNRLKGATFNKAVAQGLRTAKLPIAQHFALKATPVLAVNHVFDIIMQFAATGDWVAALAQVLPKRKEAAQLSEGNALQCDEEEQQTPIDDGGAVDT